MREGQRPKYLNTSEDEVFHKGRQLFGLDRARRRRRARAGSWSAEGYTDVLALRQAGVPETVAIMGTALTEEQLDELTRAAPHVLLALDADRSGREAMLAPRARRRAATSSCWWSRCRRGAIPPTCWSRRGRRPCSAAWTARSPRLSSRFGG